MYNDRPPSGAGNAEDIAGLGQDAALLSSSLEQQVWTTLASTDDLDPDLEIYAPVVRAYALESLHHFLQYENAWLKTSMVQRVMQREASNQVIRQAYLLHAVLAVSAAHLAFLHGQAISSNYYIASLVHWQRSLRAYSARLIPGMDEAEADAMYFTSHINSILAFVHAPPEAQISELVWEMPKWIVSLRGVHVLHNMDETADRLKRGVWQPVLQSCENWHASTQERIEAAAQQPMSPAIEALWNYHLSASEEEAILYEERINILRMLERCSTEPRGISALASFVSKASSAYIARVAAGESMALLLLMYWCRLFSRVEQWWTQGPAKAEHDRLYRHLQRKCGEDSEMQRMLDIVALPLLDVTTQG